MKIGTGREVVWNFYRSIIQSLLMDWLQWMRQTVCQNTAWDFTFSHQVGDSQLEL